MLEFIERIKAVLSEVLNIKSSLEAETRKTNEVSQNQNRVAEIHAREKANLDEREAVVKSIENIVAFKTAAETMAKEVNEGRIALDRAQHAFEAHKKDELAKIAARKVEVGKLEAEHKRELEALKKAREDVVKEMANVKGAVLDGLRKNL